MFSKTLALSAIFASAMATGAEFDFSGFLAGLGGFGGSKNGFNTGGSTGGKVRRIGYKSVGDGHHETVLDPYEDRFVVDNHFNKISNQNSHRRYGSDRNSGYGNSDRRYGSDRHSGYGSDRHSGYGSDRNSGYGSDRNSGYGSRRSYGDENNRGYGSQRNYGGHGDDYNRGYGVDNKNSGYGGYGRNNNW